MRTVGGKKGRRYSQRTAAVAPEASPKWPPPSRPPPPPPPPPPLAIATVGAARLLARDSNWRVGVRGGSRASVGRRPARKAAWEV